MSQENAVLLNYKFAIAADLDDFAKLIWQDELVDDFNRFYFRS